MAALPFASLHFLFEDDSEEFARWRHQEDKRIAQAKAEVITDFANDEDGSTALMEKGLSSETKRNNSPQSVQRVSLASTCSPGKASGVDPESRASTEQRSEQRTVIQQLRQRDVPLVTTEVMRLLRLTRRTVCKYAREGKLKATRYATGNRYEPKDLISFLKGREV